MDNNQAGGQPSVFRRMISWVARAWAWVLTLILGGALGVGDGGGQHQAWTGPENIWMTSIREWYPRLHQDTYFMPPIHFNRTPHSVDRVAGVVVKLQDNPPHQRRQGSPAQPTQSPTPVAGGLFVENPTDLQPKHVPESDWQDDDSQQRCLRSLSKIRGQTMMVVSQLTFRKYLHNNPEGLTNPLHAVAIAQLPTASSLAKHIADGESDILIIHRTHGFIVGEIKSVGGAQYFSTQSPDQQNQLIVKRVDKAVNQLKNIRIALEELVKDLPNIGPPNIRITLTLLLPNITHAQLSAALTTSRKLTKTLCQTLSVNDVVQAVNRCLCQDLLDQPSQWWDVLHEHGSDPCMTHDLYERLVARFCGPATTVDVPTACRPRVVVRTYGDAVAETGLRFSTISLTLDQLGWLNRRPQYLYLQGPPGTGKTLVLFLAALESAKQGHKVVIVHMPGDVAVATLLKLQLTIIVGATTAAQLIHLHPCNFRGGDLDVNGDVATLRHRVGQEDNVHIIVDEAPDSDQFLPWVTAVHSTWPQALLWMAGLKIRDNTAEDDDDDDDPSYRLPQWVETATLRVSLRCTPNVTHHVAKPGRSYINDITIPRYVTSPVPQHTAGPDVRELLHTPGVRGHTGGRYDLLGCEGCGDKVASVISELVGDKPGHGLQYKDIFVLTGYHCPAPRDDNAFVQGLRRQHRQHVHVVEISVNDDYVVTTPPSADDVPQLMKAVDNKIIITHWRAVCGLERRAVFVLGGRGDWASDHVASTRTTSFLSYFTCHRPAAD